MNLQTPINSTGYGIVGLNVLLSLYKRLGEGKIYLHPIHEVDIEVNENQSKVINKAIEAASQYDKNAASLKIWHPNLLAEHVGYRKHSVMTFFELDALSKRERHHLTIPDNVFVPSEWAKGICNQYDIPAKVVPLGVDREIFNENIPSSRLNPELTVFCNIGKYEVRKGQNFLCEAFHKAFGPQDNVLLKLACDNPFIGEQGNNYWKNLFLSGPMYRKVIFKPRSALTNQGLLARLIAETDVGVFPARAEGWNLEALEFLSSGKSVIATNYSGHTQFLTNQNASLIDTPNLEVANDGMFFKGQGRWAAFGNDELDQLIHHMRMAHKKKQEEGPFINKAGIETAKRFSWDNTVNHILEVL